MQVLPVFVARALQQVQMCRNELSVSFCRRAKRPEQLGQRETREAWVMQETWETAGIPSKGPVVGICSPAWWGPVEDTQEWGKEAMWLVFSEGPSGCCGDQVLGLEKERKPG